MANESFRAFDAKVTLAYEEAGLLISALDYALCHSPKPSEHALRELRPLVDKLSSTFGFPTARLDRLFKGQRVRKFAAVFHPEDMDG